MKIVGSWIPFLGDWRSLMAAVLHWFQGGDPYGAYSGFYGALYDAGYFAYPPPVLLLAAPLALLPWWLSGILIQVVAVLAFERWSRLMTSRSALIWILLWSPFVQGLFIGQTTLLFLTALLWAECAMHQRNDRWAGLFLALALLKPQVGLLAIAYLLIFSLWRRRWDLLGAFMLTTMVLWGGAFLILGAEIYAQWVQGLNAYRGALPDQPLLTLPLGLVLFLLSLLLWRQHRSDGFGLALLLNTLLYPLSVLYIISPLAPVVIRWRHDWQAWALVLGWLLPISFTVLATNFHIFVPWNYQIQAFAAATLLVGLLPHLSLAKRSLRLEP
ncbi:MAG: DUF2029 domain-containing protein [Chloroflexia bacterium]|nr:DUF2029 domain-containing protein [Chloroflexia bacterium]